MAGNLRTPRSRALEIGTESGKFHQDLAYDYAGGHPTGGPGMPKGTYSQSVEEAAHPVESPSVFDPHKPIK